jgi:hypothetical protein
MIPFTIERDYAISIADHSCLRISEMVPCELLKAGVGHLKVTVPRVIALLVTPTALFTFPTTMFVKGARTRNLSHG